MPVRQAELNGVQGLYVQDSDEFYPADALRPAEFNGQSGFHHGPSDTFIPFDQGNASQKPQEPVESAPAQPDAPVLSDSGVQKEHTLQDVLGSVTKGNWRDTLRAITTHPRYKMHETGNEASPDKPKGEIPSEVKKEDGQEERGSEKDRVLDAQASVTEGAPHRMPPEVSDYDYAGYEKKYGKPDQSKGQHLTDEFKLPNHITFSSESKYSKPGEEGGEWKKESGIWNFYASPFNLKQHSAEELKEYFKKMEPDAVLHLPDEQKGESGNSTLLPVVVSGDKKYIGKPGQSHNDVMKDNGIDFGRRGFVVSGDDTFLSRSDAKAWVKENQPDVYKNLPKRELHSEDYWKAIDDKEMTELKERYRTASPKQKRKMLSGMSQDDRKRLMKEIE